MDVGIRSRRLTRHLRRRERLFQWVLSDALGPSLIQEAFVQGAQTELPTSGEDNEVRFSGLSGQAGRKVGGAYIVGNEFGPCGHIGEPCECVLKAGVVSAKTDSQKAWFRNGRSDHLGAAVQPRARLVMTYLRLCSAPCR